MNNWTLMELNLFYIRCRQDLTDSICLLSSEQDLFISEAG